jgi:hypothetical protein
VLWTLWVPAFAGTSGKGNEQISAETKIPPAMLPAGLWLLRYALAAIRNAD